MKLKVLFFLVLLSQIVFGQNDSYSNSLDKFLKKPEIKNALVGFYAVNLNNNEVIAAHNHEISMTPASIMKLFTTATALETFDQEYKFKTELAYDGVISEFGVLDGNLFILGYGDPALGSSFFSSHYNSSKHFLLQWVDAVKTAGIKSVKGSVYAVPIIFGKMPIPDKWLWEDIANYYGAVPSGLNYNDNLYFVHFKTGDTEGAPTEIIKVIPDDIGLSFENNVLSASSGGDQAYIFPGDSPEKRIIRGTLPWKRKDFAIRGSLPNPELYLARDFIRTLKYTGVSVEGKAFALKEVPVLHDLKIINVTYSPVLTEIIDIINKRSFNLYAECIAMHLENNSNQGFSQFVLNFWKSKSMDTNGLFIVDASGLSPFNSITPAQMVWLLDYMRKSNYSEDFANSLAVSGESGTLTGTFTNAVTKGKIRAKSGSMTRVRAYAGYMQMKNNEEVAFCIILNNYNCSAFKARQLIEELFVDWMR